jgi:hypothetical protein
LEVLVNDFERRFLVYIPCLKQIPMVLSSVYVDNFQMGYIFLANIIAGLLSFVVLFPNYIVPELEDRHRFMETNALWNTYHGGRYCLCYQ